VKQCKEECEIVMQKLARIAKIIVNLCEKYNLSEKDLPASLRDILDSLQRFVSSIAIVLPGPHDLTKDQRTG
jgi:Mg2+ and Co2+ transporter CorA